MVERDSRRCNKVRRIGRRRSGGSGEGNEFGGIGSETSLLDDDVDVDEDSCCCSCCCCSAEVRDV